MSPPERLLWTRVRGSALGVRIRRQHPLGRFTVDFYCHAARLVIEIDGYCHTWSGAEDVARSDYLRANGLHVVRFEAREVMRDVASVVSAIRYELEKRLSKVGAQVEVVGLVAPSAAEDGGTSPLGGGAGAGHAAPR